MLRKIWSYIWCEKCDESTIKNRDKYDSVVDNDEDELDAENEIETP